MNDDPHAFLPNFLKGVLVAVGISLIVWAFLGRSGPPDPNSASISELRKLIESSLNDNRFIEANRALDVLLERSVILLEAEKHKEACKGFELARDLAIKARKVARKRQQPSTDDTNPKIPQAGMASDSSLGFADKESSARYYVAVCLITALREKHAKEMAEAEQAGRHWSPPVDEVDPIRYELEKGLDADPRSKRLWRLLGVLEIMTGRFALAARALEKAVEIDPRFAEAYNNLGRVYIVLRRAREAEDAFQKALLASDEGTEARAAAHYNLGLFYSDSAASAEDKNRAALRQKAARHLREFLDEASSDDKDRDFARKRIRELSGSR